MDGKKFWCKKILKKNDKLLKIAQGAQKSDRQTDNWTTLKSHKQSHSLLLVARCDWKFRNLHGAWICGKAALWASIHPHFGVASRFTSRDSLEAVLPEDILVVAVGGEEVRPLAVTDLAGRVPVHSVSAVLVLLVPDSPHVFTLLASCVQTQKHVFFSFFHFNAVVPE